MYSKNINSKNLCFIVFTKNEEHTICGLIKELQSEANLLQLKNYRVLVIDDSTDLTKQRAQAAGALVYVGPGAGLGAAYNFGLQKCFELNPEPELVVTLDGDGQVDLSELRAFLAPLQNEYHLVIGSRFLSRNGIRYSYPLLNHMGSRILSMYLSFMTGQKITDSHGGFRAMCIGAARSIQITGNHTYVQESIIDVKNAGFRIIEISSGWNLRKHGTSRIVRSVPRYIRFVGPVLFKRFLQKIFFGTSR